MGQVVALGEASQVANFVLGGAAVMVAENSDEARQAWAALPDATELVILTAAAASAVGEGLDAPGAPLTAVMP
jgi:hypothetical protein